MSPIKKLRSGAGWLDSSSPFVCNIFSNRVGREAFLFTEETGGGDTGGGAGPGAGGAPGAPGEKPPAGGAPGDRTYTKEELQAQINAAAARIREDERKRFGDYDQLKQQVSELSTAKQELQTLREQQELAGKSKEEQDRFNAEKARQTIEREKAESQRALAAEKAEREKAEVKLKELRIELVLGEALDQAKVLPSARAKAIRSFREEANLEVDADGKVQPIVYNGVQHKTYAEAAAAFLKENDFYASAGRASGSGSSAPNGAGGSHDARAATAEENFSFGLTQPAKPASSFTKPLI